MKKIVLLIAIVALFSSACGGAKPNVPDTNAISTQIAATVNAALNVAAPTSAPATAPTTAPVVPPPASTKAANPPADNGGTFSPIVFSIGENSEKPIDAMNSFPDGVTMVYAIFSGVKMTDGQAWRHEWLYNGEVQPDLSTASTWDAATAGPGSVWWLTLYNDKGIRTGSWELKLYIGDKVVQSNQFTIEKNGEPDFGPISFAGGVDANDKPIDPVDISDPTFTHGITQTFAFFNGINVPQGTAWQSQWFFNGNQLDAKDHTWNFSPTEQNWLQFGSTDGSVMDAGTYELKLSIGGNVVNIGSFVVSSN
ncbi:MAG TPA: hypothetical protein VFK30_16435 [Anaerolineae bacterium]|nr:hypothetical protein [Anaerolineae bacterium]